ncbi:MAG: cell division protein FtsQ/DivIB [Solirubrobacteraceae bacterium]
MSHVSRPAGPRGGRAARGARRGDGRERRRNRRGRRLQLRHPRLLLAMIAVVGIAVGGWMWFRSSTLVAIERVRISGVSGPGANEIRGALRQAASRMTTLDADGRVLREAVRAYPAVREVTITTQFPHAAQIRVSERVAAAEIVLSGRAIAVAGDGTLLGDAVQGYGPLPVIPLRSAPTGNTLSAPGALAAAAVLAAAPRMIRPAIRDATHTALHGVIVDLGNGPTIYFGDPEQIVAKWRAAIAVLASASSAGAVYVDVTDPQRPVAGGLSDSASAPSAAPSAPVQLSSSG